MRLRTLTLDRFGHFADQHFDFGPKGDQPDFHIVYGPNEAGKTTTMEAVLRLFYGFPMRDPYAFLHQRSNLRVTGLLDIDGQERTFSRLPLRNGALVDASGTALPETALAAHLGGFSETDYRHLLCLDDDTIERGGEEIAQAKGDIGKLLFSAAAGVADLSSVLDGVRAEADALWKKRSSKTRMAELKRDLADIDRELRQRDVTASAWKGLKKALADAIDAEADARAILSKLRRRKDDLTAQRHALPDLAEIDRLTAEIAPHDDLPRRLDYDPDELVSMLAAQQAAQADLERLQSELADLEEALTGLNIDPALVHLASDLDALDVLRSREITGAADLDRRQASRKAAEAEMARAAADLGAPEIEPGQLVLPQSDIARLETARDTFRKALEAVAFERREVAELTDTLKRAEQELAQFDQSGQQPRGIVSLLERHSADRLVPAHAGAIQAIATARRTHAEAVQALSFGTHRYDAVPDAPQTVQAARELTDNLADARRQLAQAQEVARDHRNEVARLQAQADHLLQAADLVSDEAAALLRDDRDAEWRAHRAALDADTAERFHAAMTRFDEAAQSRLAQAADLGQVRQTGLARIEAATRADQATERANALNATIDDLAGQMAQMARSVGLPDDVTAADWLAWLERRDRAAEAKWRLDQTLAEHHDTIARAEALMQALAPLLGLHEPDFDTVIDAARTLAETERAAQAERTAAQSTVARLTTDLARRNAALSDTEAEARRARDTWSGCVADLLGDRLDAERLLPTLDPLRALREADDRRRDAEQRIETMTADRRQFADSVGDQAQRHGLEPADDPKATFDRLRLLADTAKKDAERRTGLLDKRTRVTDDIATRKERIAGIDARVSAIGQLFPSTIPVDGLDALRKATALALYVIDRRQDIETRSKRLIEVLGVSDLAAARERLAEARLEDIASAVTDLAEQIDLSETAATEATEARLTAAQALAAVSDGAELADLTERKAVIELQMRDAALDHLRLGLGHRQAEEAIRRYRDSHRSDMMAATERSFAALTGGAYQRLLSQPDDGGEVLLAVDSTGAAKRAADMSKGTRFQLYLALRAAAHEQLVAQGTRLPFFCDDIFETFDEDRTRAACRVMEQIGRSGQAIYLTHHRHVVDIARAVCDTPPMVHEIGKA